MPKTYSYLVIGSNNFWYAIETTKKDALATAKDIMECKGNYGDPESGYVPDPPEAVYIYKAEEIATV